MTTVVVSDLHLGAGPSVDVLGHDEPRRRLMAEVECADQVVLLGDIVELREAPLGVALENSAFFFDALAEAANGKRVVLVPGNHDHQLAAPWLERRRVEAGAGPLPLESVFEPGGSDPVAWVARRLSGAELALAYPGIFIRPDVYATHGHYLDCHMRVATFETLAASVSRRLTGGLGEGRLTPDDYEACLAPLYALNYALAQAARDGRPRIASRMSMRIWRRLQQSGDHGALQARLLRSLLLPGAVAGLNRAGLGPFGSDFSGTALRDAGVSAIEEVIERLGVEASHVVYGHTHRGGPLPGEDGLYTAPGGTRLVNSGSWIWEPELIGPKRQQSPYWPGACVVVPDEGAPERRALLADLGPEDLRAERAELPG